MTAGSKPSDYGRPAPRPGGNLEPTWDGPFRRLGRRWPRLVCWRHGHDPIWRVDDLRFMGLGLMPEGRVQLSAEIIGRTRVCVRCHKELEHVGTSAP